MYLLKSNYISFFVVYFIISLINTLVTLYIPIFMLITLDVNRIELAYIQFLSYLSLFLGPITGFFFDKFTHKKKQIILISSVLLFCSFAFFNLNFDNLSFFGIFLALNFTCGLLIKAGMSKLMLEASEQKSIQKNIILISNASGSFGSIIPIIVFNVLISDVESINLWTLFFNICWILSSPILTSYALIKDKHPKINIKVKRITLDQKDPTKIKERKYGLVLMFLTNFFIWGDKLLEYPFTSWILSKYGEIGLLNYTYLFFIFSYLYMGGWFISRRLINQYRSRVYLSSSIVLYALLMFPLIYSNITLFLLLNAINKIVSGVMMSQLTERNVDVSKSNNNSALAYEIIRSASLLANFIFVPLGTLLSSFVPTEIIVIIVGFMAIFSITPIYVSKIN
ncbi:MAG: hypothetical protein EAX91_07180 [Candidatus Lokiarchaeota archaeon]|nr:hypothetical protein [Candidatus Lokiarchaeota archaeon]